MTKIERINKIERAIETEQRTSKEEVTIEQTLANTQTNEIPFVLFATLPIKLRLKIWDDTNLALGNTHMS